ncbi:MAG: hypothetical protein EOL89_06675 [Actinobacteria bacterium]|nr:hypothetical protein [Actinomycetota bacterium]
MHQQQALYDVISRCIYGVDLNPMAAELAKVSMWIEALQPGRPLSFLDAHIKVGNSLLGTTPALLASGIPDAAFTPIEGDDRKHASALKKRNAAERSGQGELFGVEAVDPGNRALREEARRIGGVAALSLADVHLQEQRFRALEGSEEMRAALFEADAWCAAFVQRKVPGAPAITQSVLTSGAVDPAVRREVEDLAARHRFFHWHLEFPEIFDVPDGGAPDTPTSWRGGFGCVVGNPPWERVKLQEQEFFAQRDAAIANAPNAAKRKAMIKKLVDENPALSDEFLAEKRKAEGESSFLRLSGRYPLTGRGDVNTYSVFAETFRTIIRPDGRMGIITPTGLATDATTSAFFSDTLRSERLAAFYDFENEAKIFPGVHNQFRFAVTSITGGALVEASRLAFYTRYVGDVPIRRFDLAPREVLLLNPVTGTLPMFRSRRDADITIGIYRRHPVLLQSIDAGGNPWRLTLARHFDMTNDSESFLTSHELSAKGAHFDGWAWVKNSRRWLPLYEAKMLGFFDDRFATYKDATEAQLNKGTLPRLSEDQHADARVEPLSRYWVAEETVAATIGERWDKNWLLVWRDITNASNERTFHTSVIPRAAVGNTLFIAMTGNARDAALLQATWSSLVFDYVSRQKLSGTHMTFGVVTQIACPAPSTYAEPTPWQPEITLAEYITPRVIELTYTSHRMAPYAQDLGYDGPPFAWDPERRALLKAELDAAMFHIYGLTRDEVEHVLDSFPVVRKYDERDYGEYRTKGLVIGEFGRLANTKC